MDYRKYVIWKSHIWTIFDVKKTTEELPKHIGVIIIHNYLRTGEAIEKMLQEKRISSKINYDVLKSLNVVAPNNSSLSHEDTLRAEPKVDHDGLIESATGYVKRLRLSN